MDDIVEQMSNRLDKTKAKLWDEFFEKHFNQGKDMTDHKTDMTTSITDVRHYVIEKDADGNEIRVEVTEDQVKKDLKV